MKAQYNKPLRFNSDKAMSTFHLIDPSQNERYFKLLVISLLLIYLTNEVLHVSLGPCYLELHYGTVLGDDF